MALHEMLLKAVLQPNFQMTELHQISRLFLNAIISTFNNAIYYPATLICHNVEISFLDSFLLFRYVYKTHYWNSWVVSNLLDIKG